MKRNLLNFLYFGQDINILKTEPKFRMQQIKDWIKLGVSKFDLMKNIPNNLRLKLDQTFKIYPFNIKKKLVSKDNQTIKWLLTLDDNELIECVLMQTTYGNTVCISSQVGCAMGCKFCASTLLGLKRNLTSIEMFAQVLLCNWEVFNNKNDKITHIVVMGTGEPLNNINNVIDFIKLVHTELEISYRRITISTCGIIEGIKQLQNLNIPINLALSLHAPNDTLRKQIMPIANKYSIKDILNVCFEFVDTTNRQLMIEYVLLGDKDGNLYNSTEEHAKELSNLLKNKNCMINLIPWNTVNERNFTSISNNAIHRFQNVLLKNNIHTRIRRERGSDINSACGQLRINQKIN